MPEIQPCAPTAMLSSTTSSNPANSTKRSPTSLRRSIKRRVSPDESLKHDVLAVDQRGQDVGCDVIFVNGGLLWTMIGRSVEPATLRKCAAVSCGLAE